MASGSALLATSRPTQTRLAGSLSVTMEPSSTDVPSTSAMFSKVPLPSQTRLWLSAPMSPASSTIVWPKPRKPMFTSTMPSVGSLIVTFSRSADPVLVTVSRYCAPLGNSAYGAEAALLASNQVAPPSMLISLTSSMSGTVSRKIARLPLALPSSVTPSSGHSPVAWAAEVSTSGLVSVPTSRTATSNSTVHPPLVLVNGAKLNVTVPGPAPPTTVVASVAPQVPPTLPANSIGTAPLERPVSLPLKQGTWSRLSAQVSA